MVVLVVGATGRLGREVARVLRAAGHEVRAASRSSAEWPVDLTTGAGLAAAVEGADAVVDAGNASGRAAEAVLVGGTERLLAVEAAAGVAHHVGVSIVGIDETPMAYYALKVRQEALIAAGPAPWTIVRATQFHEMVGEGLALAARRGLSPRAQIRLQPVAVADVAPVIADALAAGPRRGRVAVAGPEVHTVSELARATGKLRLPVPIPIPGALGRALRAGTLTTDRADVTGHTTFGQWLASA